MPRSAKPGRTLLFLLACGLASLPVTVVAADLLELRGTTGRVPVGDLQADLLDREFLAPRAGAGDPDTPRSDARAFPDRVIVRSPPPGPPAPDLGEQGQTSSILRIGAPPSPGSRVADGRVDRPTPQPNSRGSLPGGDTEGGIVVVRQDARALIDQVAQFYGFQTVFTRQVRGEVENTTLPTDFDAFLDRLSADRDLVFYFRNRELNVSTREENVSRVIGLGQSNPTELRAAIEAAGVDADRFPLRFIEASNSVLVDGPPSFVALVEVIAESLVRTDRPSPEITVIRGNTIERSRPGEPAQTGLRPLELGPSVLPQADEAEDGPGAEAPAAEQSAN